jgi:hypothetical protein
MEVIDIRAGADGYLSAGSADDPGIDRIFGFDAYGTGPGSNLHMVTMECIPYSSGSTQINLEISDLANNYGVTIGIPNPAGALVTIASTLLGDVNNDNAVTITDALLVARYYVSGDPSILDLSRGDVNYNGEVSIIDALKIAQYYVRLIRYF